MFINITGLGGWKILDVYLVLLRMDIAASGRVVRLFLCGQLGDFGSGFDMVFVCDGSLDFGVGVKAPVVSFSHLRFLVASCLALFRWVAEEYRWGFCLVTWMLLEKIRLAFFPVLVGRVQPVGSGCAPPVFFFVGCPFFAWLVLPFVV